MATVTTEQEFHDAIAASDTQITILNDIALTLPNTVNYNLELISSGSTLNWNGAGGTVFSVINGGTLTIGNIILNGSGTSVTLVNVQASTFIMNDDAILRNSNTTAANPAIAIGTSSNLSVGGTFLMNGGLITGIMQNSAVSCWGGTITMSGNAAIDQNQASGIYLQGGTLGMAGNARISGNVAALPATGVRATANSVINMGLAGGDTPQISGNASTNNNGGGVWLEGLSILNMNYGASISGNSAAGVAGGVGMNNATLNMSGDSVISGNTVTGVIALNGAGGGVYGTSGARVNMSGNASIFGNQVTDANSFGGGVYLNQGLTSILTMSENTSIYNNSANIGAGVALRNGTSLVMGVNTADTPSIRDNSSASFCSGIYIDEQATADLSAQSRIADNTAGVNFNGVCNSGTLRISQNVQITDGLYVNSEPAVPIIAQALGENALIQLGVTPYFDPANVPILVAVKGDSYEALADTDSTAFRAPTSFPQGSPIYLNANRNQVLLNLPIIMQSASLTIIRLS